MRMTSSRCPLIVSPKNTPRVFEAYKETELCHKSELNHLSDCLWFSAPPPRRSTSSACTGGTAARRRRQRRRRGAPATPAAPTGSVSTGWTGRSSRACTGCWRCGRATPASTPTRWPTAPSPCWTRTATTWSRSGSLPGGWVGRGRGGGQDGDDRQDGDDGKDGDAGARFKLTLVFLFSDTLYCEELNEKIRLLYRLHIPPGCSSRRHHDGGSEFPDRSQGRN